MITPIIALVGPKHAGKTSVARELARILGASWADLDALVEEQAGKSPRTLYQEGPEVFREAERQALEGLLAREGARVIAAGGGIVDNEAAWGLLTGGRFFLVYLEVPVEAAWERILRAAAFPAENPPGLPPFLDTPDPQATHRQLHERRGAAYREAAGLRVATAGKTPEALGREILAALKRAGVRRGSVAT
jgi:shikimate kinase